MRKAAEMARLADISRLILDVKLADLQAAAQKRQHSLDLLQSLATPPAATDVTALAAHRAEMHYQAWAETRRAEINLVLAHQTAAMNMARDAAREAFGKDQALRSVQSRLNQGK